MTRRILIVGYGAFGALHAAAWSRLPGVALRVADPDAGARDRAVADGIAATHVFGSVSEALRDADLVDIVSPPHSHADEAAMALRAGLPVLLEKPATRTRAEAARLADLAGAIPVQVNMILRAHPLSLRARELLTEGAIGRLVAMSGNFSGWKRMRADSSLIQNDGVHFLDLMRHLARSPIVGVDACATAHLGGPVADDIRIDTRHASGVRGELRLGLLRGGLVADSVVPGAMTRKELLLCGDGGILHLDYNRNRLTHAPARYALQPGGWHPVPGPLTTEDVPDLTTMSLLSSVFAAFLEALDKGAPPLCDLAEGAVELAGVTDAIAVSLARTARPFTPVAPDPEVTS